MYHVPRQPVGQYNSTMLPGAQAQYVDGSGFYKWHTDGPAPGAPARVFLCFFGGSSTSLEFLVPWRFDRGQRVRNAHFVSDAVIPVFLFLEWF